MKSTAAEVESALNGLAAFREAGRRPDSDEDQEEERWLLGDDSYYNVTFGGDLAGHDQEPLIGSMPPSAYPSPDTPGSARWTPAWKG